MSILQTTEETLRLTKESLARPNEALAKAVTVATGLSAYDLQAPAKNLYPVITPLRNAIPRVQRASPGDAARWRTISSIIGSGFDAMGWVPEGQRSASMSYQAALQVAPYMTLGEEDTVTFEAEAAAQGFEDIDATATLRLLQKTMRKEEAGLLGGNASLALATPSAPSLSASGTGATLPAATYSVIVVALSFEGYRNSSLSAGLATVKTITGNDGATYTLNGGSSMKSANATQAVTLGQNLFATVPLVNGAVAYAWFVGAAGSETLQAITTINSVAISAPLLAGQQAASAITADCSRNPTLAFDGLLTTGFNPANNAYIQTLSAGVAGTGSFLTSSGRGSVVELDNMLLQMWTNYRLSPTVLYINAQEQKNITNKCLTNASGPLIRYNVAADQDNGGPLWRLGFRRRALVLQPVQRRWRFRHPDQGPPRHAAGDDPGLLRASAGLVPVERDVPNVAEVLTRRQDYYRVDWPVRTRRREFGVYAEEVLAVYAPFGVGVLTNIGNG